VRWKLDGPWLLHLEHKTKERPGVLTGVGLERRRGAGSSASTAAGGARTGTVTRPAQGLSGLLDGTARPKVVLREGYGGQGGSGVTGGEDLLWWRCLPAAWGLCSDSGNTGGAA
jgi:hypothetical protein